MMNLINTNNRNVSSNNLYNQNSINGSAKSTLKDFNYPVSSSINQFNLNEFQHNNVNLNNNFSIKSLQEARALHLNNKHQTHNLSVREFESIKNRLVKFLFIIKL